MQENQGRGRRHVVGGCCCWRIAFAVPAPADAQSGYRTGLAFCRMAQAASPTPPSACWRRSSTSASVAVRHREPPGARAYLAAKAGASRRTATLALTGNGTAISTSLSSRCPRRAPRLQVGLGDGLARPHHRDQSRRPLKTVSDMSRRPRIRRSASAPSRPAAQHLSAELFRLTGDLKVKWSRSDHTRPRHRALCGGGDVGFDYLPASAANERLMLRRGLTGESGHRRRRMSRRSGRRMPDAAERRLAPAGAGRIIHLSKEINEALKRPTSRQRRCSSVSMRGTTPEK